MNSFCIFIISHGRPENIKTIQTLSKCGSTSPLYIIIDDEDKTHDQYVKKYGNNVITFNKQKYANLTDEGDNFDNRRTTTHARNACFDIAKDLGFRYFLVLDDDYTTFCYTIDEDGNYNNQPKRVLSFDAICNIYIDFLIASKAHSVSFAQGGDFIGGGNSNLFKHQVYRKCMNAWFCDTQKPFSFFSRLNEDVNTYLVLGQKGFLFFTPKDIRLEQSRTQASSGGMTEAYLDNGTYVKTFYSVMYCPSFVKIATMGVASRRIHHFVKWKNATPCIIDEKHKKN